MTSSYFMIKNGKLIKIDSISILDSGFRYSIGLFETILFVNRKPYLWEYHIERLTNSLRYFKIEVPNTYEILRLAEHEMQVRKTGLMKIIVTGGKSKPVGYSFNGANPSVIIEFHDKGNSRSKNDISLYVSKIVRCSTSELFKMKTLQGISSVMAKNTAIDNNCFDSIMLNSFNDVCETSSGNIFYYRNGKLFTPSIECGVLPGVMRRRIIEKSQIPVIESICKIKDLLQAESVFITNVSWIALNVSKIYGYKKIFNRTIADKIYDTITQDISEKCC